MAGKKEVKLSKTAEASVASSDRKARQTQQLTVVTASVCQGCLQCQRGREHVARRDAFKARKPSSMFIDRGVPCILRKQMPTA